MRYYLKRGLYALLGLAAVLFVAFALTSQPLKPHPYFADDRVLIIAHRGGKGLAPENTMAAFTHSVELRVDVLEMDLRQSNDGALIILHDGKVDRTTDGRGCADSLTLGDLQSLDAGYHFSPDGKTYPFRDKQITIPTLDEVFTAFPQIRFLIEIKDNSGTLALDLCRTVKRFKLEQQVSVASFRNGPLEAFKDACPTVATSTPSSASLAFTLLHWLRLDAAYHPTHQAFQFPLQMGNIDLVGRRLIERAHAHNVQVHAWTINEPDTMRRLIDLGVDGLITDYPDRLLKILQRLPEKEGQ